MLNVLNLDLDIEAKTCLQNYKSVRDRFVNDMRLDKNSQAEVLDYVPNKQALPSHEILIAEVDLIFLNDFSDLITH